MPPNPKRRSAPQKHPIPIADPERGVIVIVEVESGAEQVLEATIAPEKVGASFPTVTSNEYHH